MEQIFHRGITSELPHTRSDQFLPNLVQIRHQISTRGGGHCIINFNGGSKKKQTIEMRLEAEQNTLDRGISDIGRGLFGWNWIIGMLPNSSGEIEGGLSQMICSATVPNSSCPCRECNSLIDPISGNLIGNQFHFDTVFILQCVAGACMSPTTYLTITQVLKMLLNPF